MLVSRFITLALSLVAFCLPAAGQTSWPNRPIKIVVAAAPGGTFDVLARLIQEPLSKELGQPVVVEYKPGAGGAIGLQYMSNQPSDGYTYLLHGSSIVTVQLTQPKPPYDTLRDYASIGLLGTSPMILVAHKSQPATLGEFVKNAREHPGKLEWGTTSIGGVGQLAAEAFHQSAGIKGMVMVSYAGAAPGMTALAAGEIKYLISTPSATLNNFVEDGRLRYLGITSANRSELLPGVPSLSEVVPGYSAETWFGLFANSATPAAASHAMGDALKKVVAQPAVRDGMKKVFVEAPTASTPTLERLVRQDLDVWGKTLQRMKAASAR